MDVLIASESLTSALIIKLSCLNSPSSACDDGLLMIQTFFWNQHLIFLIYDFLQNIFAFFSFLNVVKIEPGAGTCGNPKFHQDRLG